MIIALMVTGAAAFDSLEERGALYDYDVEYGKKKKKNRKKSRKSNKVIDCYVWNWSKCDGAGGPVGDDGNCTDYWRFFDKLGTSDLTGPLWLIDMSNCGCKNEESEEGKCRNTMYNNMKRNNETCNVFYPISQDVCAECQKGGVCDIDEYANHTLDVTIKGVSMEVECEK